MKPLLIQLFSVLLIAQLIACDQSPDSTNEVSSTNAAPSVNAGTAQIVNEQTSVTLNGSGSDTDGSIASYAWSQTAGNSVSLNNANSAATSFDTPETVETLTLTFKLTVTDDDGATATDSVTITVEPVNLIPVANAGSPQAVDEQTTVILLAANSLDPDGSIIHYLWEQTAGEAVSLNQADTLEASFEAPSVPNIGETLQLTFQLTVTDNENATATDTVEITVNRINLAPTANAGENQTVNEQSTISLQGQGSDVEGDVLAYQWVQISGEAVEISNANQADASFVSPATISQINLTFELSVTDEQGLSNTDSVMIDIMPVVSGLVVDDLLVNATVNLLSFPGQQLIFQTQTDNNGQYSIQQGDLPESFILKVTGGTFNDENGEAFVGQLSAFCLREARLTCHATPMTTLIMEYAVVNNLYTQGNQAEWLTAIGASLNIDLSTEPFVEDSQTNINLDRINLTSIRSYLQNGSQQNQWITQVLNFINNGVASNDFYDWFPVANRAPVANAGNDQNVEEQVTVTLNGSDSVDNDGSIVSYQWTQTTGNIVTLTNADSAIATFISPTLSEQAVLTFELIVTDNENVSHSASIHIYINAINLAPVAQAGSDQNANEQTSVTLNGSGSVDNDGSIVSYQWVQTEGALVTLNNADTTTATFISPAVIAHRVLTFNLTVTDNEGETSTDTTQVRVYPVNAPPVAKAGDDQSVNEQITVSLNASSSTDNDGNITSYQWVQTAGTAVVLNNANSVTSTFTSPVLVTQNTLSFRLTVRDNEGATGISNINVIVNPINTDPVSQAGSDQNIDEQTTVTLNGNASVDNDGTITTYQWLQIAGTSVTLTNANSVIATFTSPTLTAQTTLTFRLTVTDNEAASQSDIMNVTVNPVNIDPVSQAGSDQNIDEQTTVTLNGNASVDNDGTITTYQWLQIAGASVALTNANSTIATFTSPTLTAQTTLTFRLTVTDNEGASSNNNVSVTVNPVNALPVAHAGNDQNVNEQTLIMLNDNASSDSDGSIVDYQWAQVSGTSVTLTNANSTITTFTSPTLTAQATLIFRLTVTDNEGGSSNDNVSVTINPVNLSPISQAGSDQIVNEQTLVTLSDNVSSDSDGSIVNYQWLQTSGSSVSLTNANSAIATFTSPTLTAQTTLTFRLTVTDNEGANSSDSVSVTINPVNASPVAQAGNDQNVDEQTIVILNGNASLDNDGSITSYQWLQISGVAATLANANSVSSTFTSPTLTSQTTLIFRLTVIDNEGASHADNVSVTVNPVNALPVAQAGNAQIENEQTLVTLTDNGSSDSDGSIIGYLWAQTSGTSVAITNANSATATFITPIKVTTETLIFSLTVTDNEGGVDTDTVEVTVYPVNASPAAQAGLDQIINRAIQSTGTLNGSASSDSDGTIVSYLWAETTSSGVSLTNANTSIATFTAPAIANGSILTFELKVTDNEGGTHTDSVNTTIISNEIPIADAGNSQFVVSGNTVNLNASATTDTESSNSNLVFNWSRTDSTGIAITLSDSNIEQPSFTAPTLTAAETVTFEVVVTDEGGLIDTAEVNIAIQPIITPKINDTGISLCGDYAFGSGSGNHSNSEDCTNLTDSANDPIPNGQDGHYGRDTLSNDNSDGIKGFSFTKLDTNGNPLPQSATNWSCVLDNVTKMIWEVKTISGLQGKNNRYTWYNTNGSTNGGNSGKQSSTSCSGGSDCNTQVYVTNINALNSGSGLCGATDWQLPSREELRSIVNYDPSGNAIDTNYFPNNIANGYSTSSTFAANANSVWFVSLNSANYQESNTLKLTPLWVRLVRAVQ